MHILQKDFTAIMLTNLFFFFEKNPKKLYKLIDTYFLCFKTVKGDIFLFSYVGNCVNEKYK